MTVGNSAFRLPPQFKKQELEYWKRYGVTIECLSNNSVAAIDRYTVNENSFERNEDDLWFGYQLKDKSFKIYQPNSSKFKFLWVGDKPSIYLFGITNCITKRNYVLLTGGEKDVLTLQSHGFNAVCLGSEVERLKPDTLGLLQKEFGTVIILYDNDETGVQQSELLAREYQLSELRLPHTFQDKDYGKDISDLFALVEPFDPPLIDFLEEKIREIITIQALNENVKVQRLVTQESQILARMTNPLKEQSIMMLGNSPLLNRNTINVIQGQTGTHKSRFAETLATTLLSSAFSCGGDLTPTEDYKGVLVYVDTERNLGGQLPNSMRALANAAGVNLEAPRHESRFRFTSLIDNDRKERLETISKYLEFLRKTYTQELVVIIDVISDCIENFNDVEASLRISDWLNMEIQKGNITFICLIHVNPGNNNAKARGHLGTELANKASVVMQLSLEKENKSPIDVVKLQVLKSRITGKVPPRYFVFDLETKLLRPEHGYTPSRETSSKIQKAQPDDILAYLKGQELSEWSKSELYDLLKQKFAVSERTIDNRLETLTREEQGLKKEQRSNAVYFCLEKKESSQTQ